MAQTISPARHSETAFELIIADHLLAHGYEKITSPFDAKRAIFPDEAIAFIRTTQPTEWAKLEALHGDKTTAQILTDLCKWLDTYGVLQTLRHGFKCYGRTLRIAYFQAAHGLNPQLNAQYAANRLGIKRQLHYSERQPKLSLDLVISLNGIPLITVELKKSNDQSNGRGCQNPISPGS